jgi:hypothetical protein
VIREEIDKINNDKTELKERKEAKQRKSQNLSIDKKNKNY